MQFLRLVLLVHGGGGVDDVVGLQELQSEIIFLKGLQQYVLF